MHRGEKNVMSEPFFFTQLLKKTSMTNRLELPVAPTSGLKNARSYVKLTFSDVSMSRFNFSKKWNKTSMTENPRFGVPTSSSRFHFTFSKNWNGTSIHLKKSPNLVQTHLRHRVFDSRYRAFHTKPRGQVRTLFCDVFLLSPTKSKPSFVIEFSIPVIEFFIQNPVDKGEHPFSTFFFFLANVSRSRFLSSPSCPKTHVFVKKSRWQEPYQKLNFPPSKLSRLCFLSSHARLQTSTFCMKTSMTELSLNSRPPRNFKISGAPKFKNSLLFRRVSCSFWSWQLGGHLELKTSMTSRDTSTTSHFAALSWKPWWTESEKRRMYRGYVFWYHTLASRHRLLYENPDDRGFLQVHGSLLLNLLLIAHGGGNRVMPGQRPVNPTY